MTSGPDLILGVSRAADTAKQREAAARLERLLASGFAGAWASYAAIFAVVASIKWVRAVDISLVGAS